MGRSHGNPDSLETWEFSRSLFAKSHLEKLFHKIIPHTSEAVSALPFWSSMLRSTASCTARCTASFAQPMCVRPALEPGVREDRCSHLHSIVQPVAQAQPCVIVIWRCEPARYRRCCILTPGAMKC